MLIPTRIKAVAKTATQLTSHHTPEILTGIGIAGIVGGTVLTARATIKAVDVKNKFDEDWSSINQVMEQSEKGMLDGTEHEYTRKDFVTDRTVAIRNAAVGFFKLYAFPVALTAAGVGAIMYSHKILRDREASALAAAAVISKAFEQYRQNVVDDLGVEADHAFETGRTVKINKAGELKVGKPKADADTRMQFLFDEVNAPSTWESAPGMNYIRVNTVQTIMNDRLQAKGHVFLNEVLDELGLERTSEGAIMGWSKKVNPDSYVDFGLGYTDIPQVLDFTNGDEPSVWLIMNVDGLIWDRI